MPRLPRITSEYGYYHLIARGNGKQILFEDRTDYIHYLHLLKRFSEETSVSICAYCLMENHIHLLVRDQLLSGHTLMNHNPKQMKNISRFMHKLGIGYSYYFNNKYQRTGHLFENRFGSVPINTDIQLLRTFRYILNNPREIGIDPAEYLWSSYQKYGNPASFVDTKIFVEFLGSFREYEEYLSRHDDESDSHRKKPQIHRDDEWAKSVLKDSLSIESGTILKSYDWESRNKALRLLKEKGLSLRQIERLTGISKSVIQRA